MSAAPSLELMRTASDIRTGKWRALAACTPSASGLTPKQLDRAFYQRDTPTADWSTAQDLCAQCKARPQCLAEALAHRDAWGYRAGRTPSEIRDLVDAHDQLVAIGPIVSKTGRARTRNQR